MVERLILIAAALGVTLPPEAYQEMTEADTELYLMQYMDFMGQQGPQDIEADLGIYALTLFPLPDLSAKPFIPAAFSQDVYERQDQREEWKRQRNRGHKLQNKAHKKRS